MRRVPLKTNYRYGLIGNGRVSKHIQYYFDELNIEYCLWTRQNQNTSLRDFYENCTHLLILISDDAIELFLQKNLYLQNKPTVHFSGSVCSPLAIGMHPLMTFSYGVYDLKTYQSIPFICEKGKITFEKMFPQLPNPYFVIEPEDKAYYHALCVMAGNFSQLLWEEFFSGLETIRLPRSVCYPYLKKVFSNLIDRDTRKSALTGPLQRRDINTIKNNLKALPNKNIENLYKAFIKSYDEAIYREVEK